eukprot:TRINITY_DN8501_c0_g1_i4.p1 TRINITY_DN8501_c0_g1~~TRINITY_DN8501_c0_g1_i4.p1  ORF type:complete len:253 (+),score=-32.73 TRINITY_DN8501_c0_g1_i4:210-968(+)
MSQVRLIILNLFSVRIHFDIITSQNFIIKAYFPIFVTNILKQDQRYNPRRNKQFKNSHTSNDFLLAQNIQRIEFTSQNQIIIVKVFIIFMPNISFFEITTYSRKNRGNLSLQAPLKIVKRTVESQKNIGILVCLEIISYIERISSHQAYIQNFVMYKNRKIFFFQRFSYFYTKYYYYKLSLQYLLQTAQASQVGNIRHLQTATFFTNNQINTLNSLKHSKVLFSLSIYFIPCDVITQVFPIFIPIIIIRNFL